MFYDCTQFPETEWNGTSYSWL